MNSDTIEKDESYESFGSSDGEGKPSIAQVSQIYSFDHGH